MIGGKENGWQPSPEQIENAHEQIVDIEEKQKLEDILRYAEDDAESKIQRLSKELAEWDAEIKRFKSDRRHWEIRREEIQIEIAKAKNAAEKGSSVLLSWYADELQERLSDAQSELDMIERSERDPEDDPDY